MAQGELSAVEEQVREYYESNTKRFLRFGQGASESVIHRAVWGPGVENEQQAFHYVEELILQQIKSLSVEVPRVVDLGCGAGASLSYLAARRDLSGIGITLSPTQVELARRLFEERGQARNVTAVQGTFLAVPTPDASVDAAYAIEAFVHASSAKAFLDEAARIVRPGGLLIICDDLLTERGSSESGLAARERRWLRDVRHGWRINTLVSPAEVVRIGTGFQLDSDQDLSPHLQLGRPRDYAIAALLSVAKHFALRSPWWGNLVGGHALQRCLASGVVAHRFLVLKRRPD